MTQKIPKLSQIPILDLFNVYDQRYTGADFHYESHRSFSRFFSRNVAIHRHDRLFQIHYLLNGMVHVQLDDLFYRLEGPMIFFTPPGIPHAFTSDKDTEGHVITVRQQYAWQLFNNRPDYNNLSFNLRKPLCIDLANPQTDLVEDAKQLNTLFEIAANEFKHNKPNYQLTMPALIQLIFITLFRFTDSNHPNYTVQRQDLQLFYRFNELLEKHYKEHWQLTQYANELGMTTARLHLICQRMAGISPKQLIVERLLQEAKRLLIHSQLTANEICFTLGFKDPSYFSRFFNKYTGFTTKDYRLSHHYQTIK